MGTEGGSTVDTFTTLEQRLAGCLLGGAVGDALGLPYEGISRSRLSKMYPHLLQYHFLFGHGMVSDDTEHAIMTAQALLVSGGEVTLFQRRLARSLRFWLLGIPAGIGFATLRSILRLWVGISPTKSGVFSAGNGPAMRSAILGVCFGENPDKLRELVRASTQITHTDPKAEQGAFAIALTTHFLCKSENLSLAHFYEFQSEYLGSDATEFLSLLEQVVQSVETGESTAGFAKKMGLEEGVSGYILHTVPVAIHAALSHPHDLEHALGAVLECGGDTDTVAAITGGVVGACIGAQKIPERLKNGFWEPVYSPQWMAQLATSLTDTVQKGTKQRPKPTLWILLPFRNALFLLIVLLHGFRRLLPPYGTKQAKSSKG